MFPTIDGDFEVDFETESNSSSFVFQNGYADRRNRLPARHGGERHGMAASNCSQFSSTMTS
jgi:hypothetical protein